MGIKTLFLLGVSPNFSTGCLFFLNPKMHTPVPPLLQLRKMVLQQYAKFPHDFLIIAADAKRKSHERGLTGELMQNLE